MTEKNSGYKPSKREVVGRMFGDTGRFFGKASRNIKNTIAYKNVKDFFGSIGYTGGCLVIAPYIIPTDVRFLTEPFSTENPMTTAKGIGGIIGFLGGAVGIMGQLAGGIYLANDEHHPEVLLIPLATNLASGAYEWYRKTRKTISGEHPSPRQNEGGLEKIN